MLQRTLVLVVLGTVAWCAEARTVAIFYALDKDWETFSLEMDGKPSSQVIGGQTVFSGTFAGTNIRATKMGSGVVKTALSAQKLLQKFPCDMAFSVGPVGGLDARVKLGEWFLAGSVTPWQNAWWKPVEPLAWKKHVPSEPLPEISIASGELFVDDSALRGEIRVRTKCDAVDMNLFGLLTALGDIPSAHLRVVSDNADETASSDFKKFIADYDGKGGKNLAQWIRSLPEDNTTPSAYPALSDLIKPQR